jgi:hypothetical protein
VVEAGGDLVGGRVEIGKRSVCPRVLGVWALGFQRG